MSKKKQRTPPERREAEERIRAYLDRCGETGRRPTRPGLRAALGLNEEEMAAIETGQRRWAELREPVEQAMDRIRDELEQGSGNVSLFLLKQPCYGGYTDKGEDRGEGATLRVVFGGEKGGEYGG